MMHGAINIRLPIFLKKIIKGFTYIPLLRMDLFTATGANGTQYILEGNQVVTRSNDNA